MKLGRLLARFGLAAVLLSTLNLQLSTTYAQGTAFTYQGVLSQNGAAINGSNDLTFTLYNAVSAGATVGTSNVVNDLVMTNGLFTVTLDFGAGAFDGTARWLQTAARPGASTGAYTNLAPRTPITPTPYAIYAASAATAGSVSSVAASNITGTIDDGHLFTNVARLNVGNTFSESQTIRTSAGGLVISSSTGGQFGSGTLRVQGNTGLGADPHPLYRLFVAGTLSAGSYVGDGSQLANVVAETYLGPVADNQLSANIARRTNGNTFSGNQIIANGNLGVGTSTPKHKLDVAGNIFLGTAFNGQDFTELGDTLYLGAARKYLSSTLGAPINGSPDWINLMCHPFSRGILFGTAGPSDADPHSAPNPLMVIQSSGNVGIGTTIPSQKLHVSGNMLASGDIFAGSTVGIGTQTPVTTLDVRSATPAITVGSLGNTGGALYFGNSGHGVKRGYSQLNDVGLYTTAADVYLSANGTTTSQFVLKNNGNIGIGTNSPTDKLHVAGGIRAEGVIEAHGDIVADLNLLTYGNAGIGTLNPATKLHLRGPGDTELSIQSAVNDRRWTLQASGGTDGVGLGGTFQIIDRTASAGRLGIGIDGNVTIPAELTTTAVNITSDRNAKEQFKPVNAREVLAKVACLPISEWQYKTQSGARHIGPMAQDFHEAFSLRHDDKHITSVDADGVALAAIQGLNEKLEDQLKEKNSQIDRLRAENQSFAERLAAIERALGLSRNAAATVK